jgi:hypothetical protein
MTTSHASADQAVDRGVTRGRRLIGVQTFDISRLTNHALPIVPGTFVAVSGRGPKIDSNGSGKTSFLVAVSLLLADPQWRLETNGGRWAAGVLFKPEAAGLDPSQQYAAAAYGFIAGVFAEHADHLAFDRALLDPITVWVRVATSTPYVEARWAEGLHVADGETDLERYAQAETIWSGLPTVNRSSARRMAEVLYGAAPRCLSYLDTPLRPAAPSLLSQQMTEMTPEKIGESLIALAGLTDKLEQEERQRGEVADHQRRLRDAEGEDQRIRADEDADLTAVAARDEARTRLADGEQMWRLHFAKRYLEVLAEDAEVAQQVQDAGDDAREAAELAQTARAQFFELRARTNLEEAEQRAYQALKAAQTRTEAAQGDRNWTASELSRLAGEQASLLSAREGWSGAAVEQADEALSQAHRRRATADHQRDLARAQHKQAEEALHRVRDGRDGQAGQALDLLTAAGIPAVGILDAINLDPSARAAWEPRLWPHRHAVAIAPADVPAATDTLRVMPGSQLVVTDRPLDAPAMRLPDGVGCTAPLSGFLRTLADRHPHLPAPDRASDPTLGSAVLGSFAEQIAGRAARLGRAQALLDDAVENLSVAERKFRLAELHLAASQDDLNAARAAARMAEIEEQTKVLEARLPDLDARLAARRGEQQAAEQAWGVAKATVANHANEVQTAEAIAKLRGVEADRAGRKEAEARRARDELRLAYWRDGWAGTPEAAQALLDAQPEPIRALRPRTMRHRAAEALRDALRAYGITSAEDAPEDLAEVVRRREQLAEGFGGVAGDTVDFPTLARPLRIRLDGHAETDRIIESRILTQRRTRETSLSELRTELDTRSGTLERLQDMIERLVEHSLNQVGEAFNRLDHARGGHGATLKVTSIRPDSPTSYWQWPAVPCWRRSPTSGMISYREIANGAQVKVHAIQLVLAALLATGKGHGRVLVLDELGNSLGDTNKRDVLGALKQVAEEQQVTILGTCQDSVLEAAAQVCGEVLWFTHAADADPYNHPTRVWAFDPVGNRVELTAGWLRSGRGHV